MKMKFLIILIVMIGAMSFWYFSQSKVNKERLYRSYESYLNLENKEAEKKYGNLMKGKDVKLQKLEIIGCKDKNENMECDTEIQIKNFRGIENKKEKIIFKDTKEELYEIKIIKGE
mgnify:CR=1 FL=1